MRSYVLAAFTVVSLAASAGLASAQCEAVSVVTDGRIRVIDGTDYAWFTAVTGRSFSVEVTTADGTTQVTPFAPVLSAVANCPTTTDAPGAVITTFVEPQIPQGTRWSYTNTSGLSVALRVRVGGLPFRISVIETTLFNSSWSTAGGFGTQWGLQNTTDTTIQGTLRVQESFGGSASYTKAITLPANRTTFVTTYDQFGGSTIPAGRGGSATFTHSGPHGAVQGDAYLVNSTQIIPSLFRTMRDGAH